MKLYMLVPGTHLCRH